MGVITGIRLIFPAQKRKAIMQMVLIYDRTDRKESIKHHSLMKLSGALQGCGCDENKIKTRTKHEAKRFLEVTKPTVTGRKPML